jgi:colanic acid/amylovoran biosynthesis glycosyltransferase
MRTAYILLRFPDPTETFIFREIIDLKRLGLPLQVFTLYGEKTEHLSAEMRAARADVHRLGWRALPSMIRAIGLWWRRKPQVVKDLFRAMGRQRWRDIEKSAENIIALLASFELARRLEVEGIEHIHAPWASGCATAAWAASKLIGRPFSFTARAWDIYPPDGLIHDKIRDAVLVRTETAANIRHLSIYAEGKLDKFRVTYNGVPLRADRDAPVAMRPPYRLLAMGRFVRKKGFDQLLYAAKLLADAEVDFRLTIAGDGALRWPLKWLAYRLNIADRVHFPGFVPHDEVTQLFAAGDIFIMPCIVAPSGDRDGLPTVILEALAHRVPVITTPVSGIPELIEDGVSGLLVPERNPAAIAAAVQRLIADRETALALAESGRARVREQFDPERNHRAVLELYRRIGQPK